MMLAVPLSLVVFSGCDPAAQYVTGSIGLGHDVDSTEFEVLAVYLVTAEDEPDVDRLYYVDSYLLEEVEFPFAYTAGGGVHPSSIMSWRLSAWLSASSNAGEAPQPGDPSAERLLDFTDLCDVGCMTMQDVNLVIE
jgi:hypothetical protein